MKKHWLPLVFAVLLMLAPVASADDGSALDALRELIDQIVALLVSDEQDLGNLQLPNGDGLAGEDPELGHLMPPSG